MKVSDRKTVHNFSLLYFTLEKPANDFLVFMKQSHHHNNQQDIYHFITTMKTIQRTFFPPYIWLGLENAVTQNTRNIKTVLTKTWIFHFHFHLLLLWFQNGWSKSHKGKVNKRPFKTKNEIDVNFFFWPIWLRSNKFCQWVWNCFLH